MADVCVICKDLEEGASLVFFEDSSGLFAGIWDPNPVRPGHTELVPKRHIQYFKDLNDAESQHIARAVAELKQRLAGMDLLAVCEEMLQSATSEKSQAFVGRAKQLLAQVWNRPPDAFNDGINDGVAAGQTVQHLHWHVIPRWIGDEPDPRGGIRHMFQGLGNYHQGIQE